jgi:hypothetical protein
MQSEASRLNLLRRLSDLTSAAHATEADAFFNDKSPDAYERSTICSRRNMASTGAGTGSMWLDIHFRSDAGDVDREVSYKYRDYVIRAFNSNKPINRFILEQMAGDQLVNYDAKLPPTPEQREALIATGFLRTTADITDNQTIYSR